MRGAAGGVYRGELACRPVLVQGPPARFHRRSVRLVGHDYRGGLYFVTICVAGRRRLFGEVVDGVVRLSPAGAIARDVWLATPDVRSGIVLDAFVVMPNHVHLLFGIVPDGHGVGDIATVGVGATRWVAPTETPRANGPTPGSVGAIVGQYKPCVTRATWAEHGRAVGPIWQRGFHDRVVRTDREADAVRRYIAENPARWQG